jgi:hypothetical protein
MLFVLQDQRESNALSVEIEELRCELNENSIHSYIVASSDLFKEKGNEPWLKEAVPVGTIEFVQSYLSGVHQINRMSPIEIPKELRLPKFLLRDYQIVKYADIPKDKYKFVKNASVLKQPTFIGNTSDMFKEGWFVNVNDLYQVSDVLNILSEYRVIVMDHKILGIQFYDGIPTVMPNEREIKKIQEMVLRYSQSRNCPVAYTMDVAVVKLDDSEQNKRDLALIELQNFTSSGTYGCRGPFLPQLYQDGLQWYLKHNTQIEI